MKNLAYLFVILGLLSTYACTKCEDAVVAPSQLLNCWTHSHEEKQGSDTLIFRRCDFQGLHPARAYERFTLLPDGNSTFDVILPFDGVMESAGQWAFDESDQLLYLYNSDGSIHTSYRVIYLGNDLLGDILYLAHD
jgi:hypothetical protein